MSHKWAVNWTATRNETVQDIDLMMETKAGSSRSWSWMTCTEVGWFQTASGKLRSSFLNLRYFRKVCDKLYNLSILPDEREMNNLYGGIHPATSRVFFLNGAVDPWSTMGIHVEDPSLFQRARVIQEESHCTDLDPFRATDTAPLTSSRRSNGSVVAGAELHRQMRQPRTMLLRRLLLRQRMELWIGD
jgi:hypothetical protein